MQCIQSFLSISQMRISNLKFHSIFQRNKPKSNYYLFPVFYLLSKLLRPGKHFGKIVLASIGLLTTERINHLICKKL